MGLVDSPIVGRRLISDARTGRDDARHSGAPRLHRGTCCNSRTLARAPSHLPSANRKLPRNDRDPSPLCRLRLNVAASSAPLRPARRLTPRRARARRGLLATHRRGDAKERASKTVDLIEKSEDHVDALVVDPHRTAEIENELNPREIDRGEAPIVSRSLRTKPAGLDPGVERSLLNSHLSAQLCRVEHHTPIFCRGL
jgi:hypothetical protein